METQLHGVNRSDDDNDHISNFIPSTEMIVITIICIALLTTRRLVARDSMKLIPAICTALAINIAIPLAFTYTRKAL